MDASVSFLNGNTNRKETCLNRLNNNNKYARLNKNAASCSLTYDESNLLNFKHLPNHNSLITNTTHHHHHHHLHQQQQHRHQIYARIPSSSTSANSPGKKSIQANNQLNDLPINYSNIFERSINADTNNNNNHNHNAGNSTSKSSMQINEQQQQFNNMMMKMMKGKNKIPESNHSEYDNFKQQQSTSQAEQQPNMERINESNNDDNTVEEFAARQSYSNHYNHYPVNCYNLDYLTLAALAAQSSNLLLKNSHFMNANNGSGANDDDNDDAAVESQINSNIQAKTDLIDYGSLLLNTLALQSLQQQHVSSIVNNTANNLHHHHNQLHPFYSPQLLQQYQYQLLNSSTSGLLSNVAASPLSIHANNLLLSTEDNNKNIQLKSCYKKIKQLVVNNNNNNVNNNPLRGTALIDYGDESSSSASMFAAAVAAAVALKSPGSFIEDKNSRKDWPHKFVPYKKRIFNIVDGEQQTQCLSSSSSSSIASSQTNSDGASSPSTSASPSSQLNATASSTVAHNDINHLGNINLNDTSSCSSPATAINGAGQRIGAGVKKTTTSVRKPSSPDQPKKIKRCPHVWQFCCDLLDNDKYNPSIIKWLNKDKGIFKIVKPDKVAELWGAQKNRKSDKKMNYEKMARGMRYSRREGFFKKLDKEKNKPNEYGKQLVFQFSEKVVNNLECKWQFAI